MYRIKVKMINGNRRATKNVLQRKENRGKKIPIGSGLR